MRKLIFVLRQSFSARPGTCIPSWWQQLCRWRQSAPARISNRQETLCRPVSPAHNTFGDRNFTAVILRVWGQTAVLLTTRHHTSLVNNVGCVAQLAERRSLAGELTLSFARPAADGWPLCG